MQMKLNHLLLRCKVNVYKNQWCFASSQCLSRTRSDFLEQIRQPSRREKVALLDPAHNVRLTYQDLDEQSSRIADAVARELSASGRKHSPTLGCFNKPSTPFVLHMLATWKLGKTFVPMCSTHSINELEHVITDSSIQTVLISSEEEASAVMRKQLNTAFMNTTPFTNKQPLPGNQTSPSEYGKCNYSDNALIMYTSGTTGRPKGVVHTHRSLDHMMQSLIQAWQYSAHDKILHFLPLYHMHGLMNKLLCVLNVGGTVEFLPSAAAPQVWTRLFEESFATEDRVSLFMAVPTVYAKMLEHAHTLDPEFKERAIVAMKRMRLMACGSAALPDVVMDQWKAMTGQQLLERYGMTEIGMALSNPYAAERRKGHVGQPLPYVQCKIVDEQGRAVEQPNSPGELLISGPCVFKEYLNNEKATKESFVGEWFKTGDIAEVTTDHYYKILGRNSSDIIKSSGYKISALEIERELLSHPQIAECAVVGVPDVQLGEVIVAVLAVRSPWTGSTKERLDEYLSSRLAKYKTPRKYFIVDQIPRNHLGKVNKKTIVKDLNLPL